MRFYYLSKKQVLVVNNTPNKILEFQKSIYFHKNIGILNPP